MGTLASNLSLALLLPCPAMDCRGEQGNECRGMSAEDTEEYRGIQRNTEEYRGM